MTPQSLKLIFASTVLFLSAALSSSAQTTSVQPASVPGAEWPKTINTATGTIIHLYSPQILSYSGDSVQSRSVISVQGAPDREPVFGVAWTTARVVADQDAKLLTIEAVRVDRLSIPGDNDKLDHDLISFALEANTPRVEKTMTVAAVQTSLQLGQQQEALAKADDGMAPKVYFAMVPTALVLIDGDPVLVKNERWGLNFVKNTRNVIVQDNDGQFYLYGAGYWYVAPSATGPYVPPGHAVSHTLRKIEQDLAKAARKSDVPFGDAEMEMSHIIVSTVPAVLLQSDGKPEAKIMPNSPIFYVTNSDDPIFYDTVSRHFYVQCSGNWFQGDSLYNDSHWRLISKVDLPAELLVSLSGWQGNKEGTVAARMAQKNAIATNVVMEQQVPQTARVDRTITTSVDYDGEPRFAAITGTALEYATNTCSIVLRYNGDYYALDNGIWFVASGPLGAWRVSDVRPDGVELISHKYRAYRAKFVYIYQTTPTAVYEGYLPGYQETPVDGCGMSVAYDRNWSDMAWNYDLDYVFDWGFGWLNGYYRYDPWNFYYGYMVFDGPHPGWRWKAYGPGTKNGGGSASGAPGGGGSGGYASRGVAPHGRPPVGPIGNGSAPGPGMPPHPPGGWGQRTQNIGYAGVVVTTPNRPATTRYSGGPSGNSGGLRGLPSGGGPVQVGNTGAPVSRGGGGYNGGGIRNVSVGGGARGFSGGGYNGGGNGGGGVVRSVNSSGGNSGGGSVNTGGGGGHVPAPAPSGGSSGSTGNPGNAGGGATTHKN